MEDGFYVWLLPARTSAWTYVGSAALLLFTFGCCLFPIAPYWVKLGVLYVCVGLLALIFGLFLGALLSPESLAGPPRRISFGRPSARTLFVTSAVWVLLIFKLACPPFVPPNHTSFSQCGA